VFLQIRLAPEQDLTELAGSWAAIAVVCNSFYAI
jgi:hypothetical protein